MRLLLWNVAGRVKRLDAQGSAVGDIAPDVLALTEVTVGTLSRWRDLLRDQGFAHVCSGFDVAPDATLLRGPRRYGQLLAARCPLVALPPDPTMTWPERLLSTEVQHADGTAVIHVAHVPPGSSNGWIKIEVLEGILRRVSQPSTCPQVLCGDFNAPQAELADGTVITWGQKLDGRPGRRGPRWDTGERNVIAGQAVHGLIDAFRDVHGYERQEFSWYLRRGGLDTRGSRFDHVFASHALRPTTARYLHDLRTTGLSDHSAMEVVFATRGRSAAPP